MAGGPPDLLVAAADRRAEAVTLDVVALGRLPDRKGVRAVALDVVALDGLGRAVEAVALDIVVLDGLRRAAEAVDLLDSAK